MKSRTCILEKMERYIDGELNPCRTIKNNLFDNTRDDFKEVMLIDQILESLKITRLEFEQALSISEDDSFQKHFKRETNSCFVNNYLSDELIAWEGNIDIRPAFSQYKINIYMCIYKTEDECSLAMYEILEDAFERKLGNYEQMIILVCLLTYDRM